MLKRGWDLDHGLSARTHTDDYPFQAYIYVSKRKDGVGRTSSFHRRLVRRVDYSDPSCNGNESEVK